MTNNASFIKCGINPKPIHYDGLLANQQEVGFLEFHTENLFAKGQNYEIVKKLRTQYEFSLHSIGLSLGSADGLDENHLEKIAHEIEVFEPILISEHLSFSGANGYFTPDLLPLPLNDESLKIFQKNIDKFQTKIKRQILIENPSQYIALKGETYLLGDFMNKLCSATGCGILLDVNNLEVCRNNIGANPFEIIDEISKPYVKEIHLAGYKLQKSKSGKSVFLDSHSDKVFENVWKLYELAIMKFGNIPSLVEWDNDVPNLEILLTQTSKANQIKQKVLLNG